MLRARHSYQCALSAGHQRVPCRFPEFGANVELIHRLPTMVCMQLADG